MFRAASEVGFGAVIAALPAFRLIRDALLFFSGNPRVTASVSTTAWAGITGSASGGMTIAVGAFGENMRTMAEEQGVSLELLHRITTIAPGGLDTLSHSGAVITLFLICGVTRRQAYKVVGIVMTVFPVIVVSLLLGLTVLDLV